ncbi:transketolase [Solwaraspora sp. WMMD937]|uniref:transketolase family protein n=1 Tax=Solwaraspora sp. WMMD937 TaxID=3016090 RepID=UPI00249A4705|nr:transketolase [Solwaraspora sp. WMMD937]WFE20243.1 transketolase [Solwaraspora sp. WMMD937]
MTLPGRAAYRDELTRLAAENERIVCLEADLGGRGHPFAQAFPDRFFNVGIAEGAMIDMAAGLAAAGYQPFVSTFAPFAALRAAESIKLAMGYYGAGITVVAPYAGVSGAWFGTTHHCLEDLAVLCAMPGITVAAPYGEREMRAVVRRAARTGAPHYIRTGRNAAPESLPFTGDEPPVVLWDDTGATAQRTCLVSAGEVGTELCLAVRRARPELPHAHLCLLDRAHLTLAARELARRYDRFVVVEEHRASGGTASTLALLLPGQVVRSVDAGVRWPSHGGSHQQVLDELGLNETAVWDALAACDERQPLAASVRSR